MTHRVWRDTPLVGQLIGSLRRVFGEVDDPRNGANTQYDFDDIAMSAFSAFFIQSPSFLDHQRVFHKSQGNSACGSLFGIRRLPTDNHIRKQLDRIACTDIYGGFDLALEELRKYRALKPFQALGGHTLIALDGSEFHNSRKVSCGRCQHRVRNRGKEDQFTEYYHSVLAAVMVGPGHPYAVPLRPEFISPQDGDTKQDCEIKAAYRWMQHNAERYADLSPIYLGDDIYAKEPMCRKFLAAGGDFICRVKTDDHKTLFSYLDGIDWPDKTVIEKTPGPKKPNREYRYRWTDHRLPLTANKDPLQVWYVELCIRNVGSKGRANTFRFITSIRPDRDNVAEIVACGRTRWKCENEAFNLLKNQGYHVEHNFGHGEDGLSNTLLTLNLIAFAFHGACDQLCALWHSAHRTCFRRKRFFATLDMLTEYIYFNSWHALLTMIACPSKRPVAKMGAPP